MSTPKPTPTDVQDGFDFLAIGNPEKLAKLFRMRAMPFNIREGHIPIRASLTDSPDWIAPTVNGGMVIARAAWRSLSSQIEAFYDANSDAEIWERNATVAMAAIEQGINPAKLEQMVGYRDTVYLARTVDPPVVHKIGIAGARHLWHRMQALRVVTGRNLELLHWFFVRNYGSRKVEGALHALFNERQIIGEWFNLTDADVDWILRNTPPIEEKYSYLKGICP